MSFTEQATFGAGRGGVTRARADAIRVLLADEAEAQRWLGGGFDVRECLSECVYAEVCGAGAVREWAFRGYAK